MFTADWPLSRDTPSARAAAASSAPGFASLPIPAEEPSLRDFTQVLTHHLRNLLAGIEGCTDLLAETLGTQEQRELALRILEGTARIEHVLADLQHFSRPFDPMLMPMRVGDVVEHVLITLRDDDLHRLALDVQDEDRDLVVDPLLLGQALTLMVQNALEAPPHYQRVLLRVAFDDAAGVARFDVWNEGVIEPKQAAERAFEPFFTTKASNLGIGLVLAQRIALAHRGTLHLTSNNPLDGTCFTLQLPVTPEPGAFPSFDADPAS